MIFDVETDGLELSEVTKIHVFSYTEGNSVKSTNSYDKMREIIEGSKLLIGHNIIFYDVPVLEKILGIKIKARIIDTLPLSWYLYPKKIIHGLESWGDELGIKKPPIKDWKNLSYNEYKYRCESDVKINRKLWLKQKEKLLRIYGDKNSADRLIRYLVFKLDCAKVQANFGWKLDVARAEHNFEKLTKEYEKLLDILKKVMPRIEKTVDRVRPSKPYKKDGTYSVAGAKWFKLLVDNNLPKEYDGSVTTVVGYEEPNPGSSDQVKNWLYSLGWKPTTFKYVRNSDGEERKIPQVRIDGGEGKELCPSVIKLIEDNPDVGYLENIEVVKHRLGIFKGFLSNHKNGRLRAEIAGLTNTLRFKHRILVNLPGVSKPWGEEIRGCLIADEGEVLCGSDMVSLEDTTKRHFMYFHDPEYVDEMSKPGFDPHLDLAKFAGAVTQEQITQHMNKSVDISPVRKKYKVANYACVYGVQAPRLSRDNGFSVKEAQEIIDKYWERNWSVRKVSEDLLVKTVDQDMWLFNPVAEMWYSLRHQKDRFSTLNQGTGVYCFDTWIMCVRKRRKKIIGQFHDEIVAPIPEGKEEDYEKLLRDSIDETNTIVKLNVKLDIDVKFGKTYADVH